MKHAVIVGIDRYKDAPLSSCVADASTMADCLSFDQYGFDCHLVIDELATRTRILEKLAQFAYSDERGEMLLFYFAGHGMYVGNAGHLVTVDAEGWDPGVSLASVAQLMESASMHFDHVVTVLDCCHAGAAFSWVSSRPLMTSDIEREVPVVNQSRCILAACRDTEQAIELKGGHGVFTGALLEGLLGSAVDFQGEVTLLGLHEWAARSTSSEYPAPLFRGDMAGTVVLGTGFHPRVGAPISAAVRQKEIGKAQRLVDEYAILEQRERLDRSHYMREGAAQCSRALTDRLKWFKETVEAFPDLERDRDWASLTSRLRDYQNNLADLAEGIVLDQGRVTREIGHGVSAASGRCEVRGEQLR